jgi:hypothetical protein
MIEIRKHFIVQVKAVARNEEEALRAIAKIEQRLALTAWAEPMSLGWMGKEAMAEVTEVRRTAG